MATLSEIFKAMPEHFKPDAAGDMEATIFFDLTGDDGEPYYAEISGGSCATHAGVPDNPTATIRMAAQDYKDMLAGRLNAMTAFMTGKIKVEGDLATVMKFQTIFDF